MLKYFFIRLSLLWLVLICLLGAIILIAPHLPSKGTLLLTHNVFLNRYERFEFYDISRQLLYGFTPDMNADIVSASFAPNGRYLAFINFNNDLANLNISTLSGEVLTESIVIERLSLGSWSRNSRYFVQEDGASRIFIFDIVASTIAQVDIQGYGLSAPSWSSDSRQVTFVGSNADDSYQIWIVDMSDDNLRQIVNTSNIIRCPIFSPDGYTIAYFQRGENGNQLQYINLDGSINHMYQSGEWRTTDCPLWSADGRYIVFMAFLSQEYTTHIVLFDVLTGETEVIREVDPTTNIQWWR